MPRRLDAADASTQKYDIQLNFRNGAPSTQYVIEKPPSACARGPSVATHCAGNACLPSTSGRSNLKLLRVSVESLKQKDTTWTRASDEDLRGRPGVAVRLVPAEDIKKYRNGRDVLHDGCLHLHAAPPLPWSSVDEFDLPLVDGKHAFPAQCVAMEGPRAQSLGGFSITY